MQVEQGQMLLTVDGPVVANAIIRLNGYVFGTEQVNIYTWSLYLAYFFWMVLSSCLSSFTKRPNPPFPLALKRKLLLI